MLKKRWITALMALLLAAACTACAARPQEMPPENTEAPREEGGNFTLPDDIRVNAAGIPQLKVYVADEKEIREMDLEDYLCGVLAGEMKNDWPEEALKAQAILARTFVIRFISEKQSRYAGADISTDIEEAQAYDAEGVNERIRQAVAATRGQIVCYRGEPIYAWFHAHAGGRTATAAEGLSYQKTADYTQAVDSRESDQAPDDAQTWQAHFPADAVLEAAGKAGVDPGNVLKTASAGEKGESGRLKYIVLNGKKVPANEFRIALGSEKMKSTLITEISLENGVLQLSGKGYGHGVGMSQWGAYGMAEKGEKAGNIIHYYFKNVDIVQMWK